MLKALLGGLMGKMIVGSKSGGAIGGLALGPLGALVGSQIGPKKKPTEELEDDDDDMLTRRQKEAAAFSARSNMVKNSIGFNPNAILKQYLGQ